jgi:LisH domain-containing protein ARMC9
VMI